MKRSVINFALAALGFAACAFSEPLIFDFGGGSVTYNPGTGALSSGNISVLDVRGGSVTKTCSGCVFSFTTAPTTANTTVPPFFYSYTFGANGSATAFQINGFNLPGQNGSPDAGGTLGSTTIIAGDLNPGFGAGSNTQYLYGMSNPAVNEVPTVDFNKLLTALGFPIGPAGAGSLVLNFATGPQPNPGFTVGVTGGTLDLDATPEPGTWLMLAGGLFAVGLMRRRSAKV